MTLSGRGWSQEGSAASSNQENDIKDLQPAYTSERARPGRAGITKTEDEAITGRFNSKRRRSTDDVGESRRKKVTKKTDVACEFCKGKFTVKRLFWQTKYQFRVFFVIGRKLRCGGEKPKCKACLKRNQSCEYNPYPRRRGPGKAPKGTKSKKRDAKPRRSTHSQSVGGLTSDNPPEVLDETSTSIQESVGPLTTYQGAQPRSPGYAVWTPDSLEVGESGSYYGRRSEQARMIGGHERDRGNGTEKKDEGKGRRRRG
jgi:Fungal Zn(2)-Cys(6) binuclear cluster domain